MNHIISVGIVLSMTLFFSCKKEKSVEPETIATPSATPLSYTNYSALKVGNYWIYQRFYTDDFGVETPMSIIDSCYIEKDTVILGNTYYKYMSPKINSPSPSPDIQNPHSPEYYRDSLSYLVSSNGRIEFSSEDFTKEFKNDYQIILPLDTVCHFIFKMDDKDVNYTTPSGIYKTSNFKETYYMFSGYNTGGLIRTKNKRYSENIGKVSEGFYFFVSVPRHWERKLIRYHLN